MSWFRIDNRQYKIFEEFEQPLNQVTLYRTIAERTAKNVKAKGNASRVK